MDEGEEGPLASLVSATEGEQSGLTLKAVLKENSRLKMALNAHAIVALTDARGVITAVNGVVAQMPVAAEVGSGDERDELGSG